jgi:hypothetical protein
MPRPLRPLRVAHRQTPLLDRALASIERPDEIATAMTRRLDELLATQ